MSHHEYDHDHYQETASRKKFSLNRKTITLVLEGAGLLFGALAVGFAVLVVNYLGAPATDALEAITQAWQSVLDWFKPLVDLYNQTLKLIPGLSGE